MQRKPGDKFGPHELISLIGKGGMGEVWKARDTRLDRLVAIKFCGNEFAGRFLREARAVAALNHANICTLYDIGPDFLVMEYIEGAPPRGPLSPPEAIRVALGIAAGLEVAHGRGITHRDLKPANVLVTQSSVKLLDFGLALVNDDAGVGIADAPTALSVPGAVMGTVAYMSPEQAQGKPADARSDIFSFGVTRERPAATQQFIKHQTEGFCGASSGAGSSRIMAAMVSTPVPPLVRYRYAFYYLHPLGRVPEAMEQYRLALENDPLSMLLHWGMAYSMQSAKQYREAIEYARRALEIDANYWLIWIAMGLAQLGAGLAQEAITSFKRVVELASWYDVGPWLLSAAYFHASDHERCQELVKKLGGSHGHSFGAALYYAAVGEVIRCLKRSTSPTGSATCCCFSILT
jgi:serine/threonine protein kinase